VYLSTSSQTRTMGFDTRRDARGGRLQHVVPVASSRSLNRLSSTSFNVGAFKDQNAASVQIRYLTRAIVSRQLARFIKKRQRWYRPYACWCMGRAFSA
jgi:hypothetical protein